MKFLTEDSIKHAALQFLKSHYKYRPRIGDTTSQIDNETKNGIIADGFLSFQTDIENRFEATIEATSHDKAHEVKYKIKESRLRWDSIMVAFIITTVIFSIIYNGQYVVIAADRVLWAILCISLSISLLTVMYHFIFRTFSSYRQIYALEQFKLYDANEQWVAVGYDVFENPDDKYLKELKRQCVLYGFGLMIVDGDLDIRQSITPAQFPMEGKKRRGAKFEALRDVAIKEPGVSNRFKNYTDTLTSSFGWDKEKRFRYDFKFQLFFILLCSIIMGIMLWKESKKTKEHNVDNSFYKRKMRKKESQEEGNEYIVDEEHLVRYRDSVDEYDMSDLKFFDEDEVGKWYNKEHQDSLYRILNNEEKMTQEEVLRALNRLLARDSFKIIHLNNIDKIASQAEDKLAAKSGKTKKKPAGLSPLCKEYANWYGKRYILRDGMYKSKLIAEFRTSQINKATVLGGILKGSCFGHPGYYIVYVDTVYRDQGIAKTKLPYFDTLLKEKGYSSGDLELMTIGVRR
ncbi:MAG: hypothetical protein ACI94Y_002263 [Maribacter sp.]|jgi:hypothetical protein